LNCYFLGSKKSLKKEKRECVVENDVRRRKKEKREKERERENK